MGNDAGQAQSAQAIDAKGNMVNVTFKPLDSRHATIHTAIGTPCTQITNLSGDVGAIRFAELTATVACHYKLGGTKTLLSGAAMTLDAPYLPANTPKIIALGDFSYIGVRAAAGALTDPTGTLHITLLY